MCVAERSRVVNHQGEVTATACARHLPCKHIGESGILVDVFLHSRLHHGRKEGRLRLEGCSVGYGESGKVCVHDGLPALLCSMSQCQNVCFVDVFPLYNGASGAAREHGNEAEMLLQPAEYGGVGAGLDALRPIVGIVVVAAESRDADADGVLGTADDAVGALGVVLEAEDEFCQHLRIHVGKTDRPDALYLLAGRGG